MRYDPMRIVLFCDDSMILPNRHPLKSLADVGYEVFLSGSNGIDPELPEFRRNQIYICIDPLREDFDLRFRGDNVVPVLMYSYRRNGLDVFLQFLRSRYAGIMSIAQLYIYDCTADEFMQDDNFPNAVEGFGEIVVKQEYRDGMPMASGIAPRHFARRRPCRYPFECLTLDGQGNVLQCPYSRRVLTTFNSMDTLKNDSSLLRFLAKQLLMDMDDCPECRNCQYWLDGWLADESKTITYHEGRQATVLYEGHTCRVVGMEEE